MGEIVSSPCVGKLGDRINDCDTVNLGGGKIVSVKDKVACTPSAHPPPLGDSGYVGQGSVVPCGSKPIASQGNVDPAPWMVSEEIPSRTGQPPQTLARAQLGDVFKTPLTSVSKRLGSGRLTPGAYSALRGVLQDHKEVSDEEKMHLMLKSLMDNDPSFKGSLGSCRSGRSQRTERSEKSSRSCKGRDLQ